VKSHQKGASHECRREACEIFAVAAGPCWLLFHLDAHDASICFRDRHREHAVAYLLVEHRQSSVQCKLPASASHHQAPSVL